MKTSTRTALNRIWGRATVAWENASRALYRAEKAGRPAAGLRATERARWDALCTARAAAEAARTETL